jgi:hypothetical protein
MSLSSGVSKQNEVELYYQQEISLQFHVFLQISLKLSSVTILKSPSYLF